MSERLTYTVPEVAELLGISRSTAYECVRRGEIPALQFGRRVLVAKATIDALVATTSVSTKSHARSINCARRGTSRDAV